MNKRQIERFQKLIRSTEDANPTTFNMKMIAYDGDHTKHPCGTPACVFGNFAARTDLQKFIKIKVVTFAEDDLSTEIEIINSRTGREIWIDNEDVEDYFGLNENECRMLFSTDGCGNAKTPQDAVKYLKTFLQVKIAMNELGSNLCIEYK